jgi:hypothetical protein
MLDHPHGDDRQLFDLMTRRLAQATKLSRDKGMAAVTARRPVLNDLIHRRERQQLTAMTLMPRLRTRPAPRRILTPRRPLPRRIRARRTRRITRTTTQLALKLLHPRLQLLDTTIHHQQNLNYSPTPRVINRLRPHALHTPRLNKAKPYPPTN